VFARLVVDRLREGLTAAWAMSHDGPAFVRQVVAQCEAGAVTATAADITRAIEIGDEARRRADPFGQAARRSA